MKMIRKVLEFGLLKYGAKTSGKEKAMPPISDYRHQQSKSVFEGIGWRTMSDPLKYNGYHGSVEISLIDDCLHGRLLGIEDVITYEGNSVQDIKVAFIKSVHEYIETCRKIGKSPERPYSGKVMFRIDPAVHAKAALAAQLKGISLNQWTEDVLREAAR